MPTGSVTELGVDETREWLGRATASCWVLTWDAAGICLCRARDAEPWGQTLAGREARLFCPEWELRLRPTAGGHRGWLYREGGADGHYDTRPTQLLLFGQAALFDDRVRLREVAVQGARSAEVDPAGEGCEHQIRALHYLDGDSHMVVLTRYLEVSPCPTS